MYRIIIVVLIGISLISCEKESKPTSESLVWNDIFKRNLHSLSCYEVENNTLLFKRYFNADGYEVYAEYFDAGNSEKNFRSTYYEYERDGFLKSKTMRDSTGTIDQKVVYTLHFDNNNKLVEAWCPYNYPYRKATFEYNSDGQIIKRHSLNSVGLSTINEYSYNGEQVARVVSTTTLDDSVEVQYSYRYTFYDDGNIRNCLYSYPASSDEELYFTYDENGFLKNYQLIYYDDMRSYETGFEMDDLGRCVTISYNNTPHYRYEYSGDFEINYYLEPGDYAYHYQNINLFIKFWTVVYYSSVSGANTYFQY